MKMKDKVAKNNGDWKTTEELLSEYWGAENDGMKNDEQTLTSGPG